jgi:hypothetical protein
MLVLALLERVAARVAGHPGDELGTLGVPTEDLPVGGQHLLGDVMARVHEPIDVLAQALVVGVGAVGDQPPRGQDRQRVVERLPCRSAT